MLQAVGVQLNRLVMLQCLVWFVSEPGITNEYFLFIGVLGARSGTCQLLVDEVDPKIW
ncbi:hypothetical protein D3C80_2083530 [compost metagenome]